MAVRFSASAPHWQARNHFGLSKGRHLWSVQSSTRVLVYLNLNLFRPEANLSCVFFFLEKKEKARKVIIPLIGFKLQDCAIAIDRSSTRDRAYQSPDRDSYYVHISRSVAPKAQKTEVKGNTPAPSLKPAARQMPPGRTPTHRHAHQPAHTQSHQYQASSPPRTSKRHTSTAHKQP